MLAAILALSLIGSLLSVFGAAGVLLAPGVYSRFKPALLGFAIGALLGASFLVLLPDALADRPPTPMLGACLGGFLAFLMLEKVLRGSHPHAQGHVRPYEHSHEHAQAAGVLILLGDALHNLVDGALIAIAFLASPQLGLVTTWAVVAHEVPQELGDFVILLEAGYSPRRALLMNLLSGVAALVGALLAYTAHDWLEPRLPWLLAIAAGTFLYVAATDLAPILHHRNGLKGALAQFGGLFAGIASLWGLHLWLH